MFKVTLLCYLHCGPLVNSHKKMFSPPAEPPRERILMIQPLPARNFPQLYVLVRRRPSPGHFLQKRGGDLALVHPVVVVRPDKRLGEARIHDHHVEIRHGRILGHQLPLVALAIHLHQKPVAAQNIRRLVQNTVLEPDERRFHPVAILDQRFLAQLQENMGSDPMP